MCLAQKGHAVNMGGKDMEVGGGREGATLSLKVEQDSTIKRKQLAFGTALKVLRRH